MQHMMQDEILDAALQLAPAARRQLAAALLASIDSDGETGPEPNSEPWTEDFEQSAEPGGDGEPRALSAEDFLRDLDEQVALRALRRKRTDS